MLASGSVMVSENVPLLPFWPFVDSSILADYAGVNLSPRGVVTTGVLATFDDIALTATMTEIEMANTIKATKMISIASLLENNEVLITMLEGYSNKVLSKRQTRLQ